VAEVAMAAVERARAGKGPSFIEAKTLRFAEHDIGTPDLRGWEARSDEEHEDARAREPVVLATKRVLDEKILTKKGIEKVRADAEAEIARIEAFADESPIARPSEEELLADVYAP